MMTSQLPLQKHERHMGTRSPPSVLDTYSVRQGRGVLAKLYDQRNKEVGLIT